jgi:ankyrin repeat protein
VERNQCWVLGDVSWLASRNTAEDAVRTAAQEAEAVGDAQRIESVVLEAGAQKWVAQLVRILTHSGDDAIALARPLLGYHVRPRPLTDEERASDMPGALPGEADDVWIDDPGIDTKSYTLLMQVAKVGREDLVRFLLQECGARARVRAGRHQMTALHLAAHHGAQDCVRTLLEHGADPNAKNWRNESAADAAAQQGHQDLATYSRTFERHD